MCGYFRFLKRIVIVTVMVITATTVIRIIIAPSFPPELRISLGC